MVKAMRDGILATALVLALVLAACAAPAPTATPTTAPVAAPTPTKAAPTPTKAPTATPTKRPLVKVTLTTASDTISFLPVYVAQGLAYFQEEGLDLERVVTGKGSTANAAVVGGSAQFVASTATEPINATAQGDRVLAIVQGLTAMPTSNLIMRKDVADRLGITEKSPLMDKVKALKGLIIGISSAGGVTDSLARYALQLARLDPERDVEIVALGDTASHLAAFRQGTIDVMVRASPTSEVPLAEGWGITLVDYLGGEVKELSGMLNQTINMRRDYAETNPGVTLSATRAIVKSLRLIQQKEGEAKEVARQFYKELDPRVFDETWRGNYSIFSKDGVPTKEGTQKHIDFINAFAQQPVKVAPEDVILTRYAEQAKRELADWRP